MIKSNKINVFVLKTSFIKKKIYIGEKLHKQYSFKNRPSLKNFRLLLNNRYKTAIFKIAEYSGVVVTICRNFWNVDRILYFSKYAFLLVSHLLLNIKTDETE